MATDSNDNDLSESAPLLTSVASDALQVSYGATVKAAQEAEENEPSSDEEELFNRRKADKGLPPAQLLILFALRFTTPMAFSQIFPVSSSIVIEGRLSHVYHSILTRLVFWYIYITSGTLPSLIIDDGQIG